jgi:CRP-like cAMP-binding protein
MKTMIPLRIVGITGNVAFIAYALLGLRYGIFDKLAPIFVLHSLLLPLNILRLCEMRQLTRKAYDAAMSGTSVECLVPYMKKETYGKGHTLFRKGDAAETIYFIESGAVAIPELDKLLTAGSLFGEVGIFTPNGRRSASAICAAPTVMYCASKREVLRLCYQKPEFGFFIARQLSRYGSESVETVVQLTNRQEHGSGGTADLKRAVVALKERLRVL